MSRLIFYAKFLWCELTHHQWKGMFLPPNNHIDYVSSCQRCGIVFTCKDGKEIR
jgi:hypothetical protein